MSVQTLYTAATGMESMQRKLDVIANNLANINTTGFKRDRANFEDLFYRNELLPGAQDSNGYTPTGVATGLGSRVTSVQTDHSTGAFLQTKRQLDVAIEGKGFFEVQDGATGQTFYTRAGHFDINANGEMVVGSANTGRLLASSITIPADTTGIVIGADGQVSVRQGDSQTMNPVGTIQLASFPNEDGLLKLGENLYAETDASGAATRNNPGVSGVGVLRQNMLEASNVEPVQELIDLITTQRSFELNSQSIQVGDEMLQLISNLRR